MQLYSPWVLLLFLILPLMVFIALRKKRTELVPLKCLRQLSRRPGHFPVPSVRPESLLCQRIAGAHALWLILRLRQERDVGRRGNVGLL